MNGNLVKDLLVLGLIALVVLPSILAEVVETTETGEMTGEETSAGPLNEPTDAATAQLLSAAEVASLQARAEQPGEKVAGGALTNQQLTYIVIALAAAVIVLILV